MSAHVAPTHGRYWMAGLSPDRGPVEPGSMTIPPDVSARFPGGADEPASILSSEPLADRSILLVAGQRDTVAPAETCHRPLVRALEERGALRFDHVALDDDHHFLNRRIALARAVVGWLSERSRERE